MQNYIFFPPELTVSFERPMYAISEREFFVTLVQIIIEEGQTNQSLFVAIEVQTDNSTATLFEDFAIGPSTFAIFAIRPGVSFIRFPFDNFDDNLLEGAEEFTLLLSRDEFGDNPEFNIGRYPTTVVKIIDDECKLTTCTKPCT